MSGYILAKGSMFLSRAFFWVTLDQAHIFTPEQAAQIVVNSRLWKECPTHVFAAVENDGIIEFKEMFTVNNFAEAIR